jgi:hypothetical protein
MATTSASSPKPFHAAPRHAATKASASASQAPAPRRTLALSAVALAVAALVGGALTFQAGVRSGMAATPEAFTDQMEAVARGDGESVHHVFGGTIRAVRNGSTLALVADNVPPSACVSVGWKLVRKGLLSINGTMPLRVSAARLSELCNEGGGNAVLTWIPRTPA